MTTLKQCIAAWQALRAIATQAMDYKSAHALVLLMERLRPHVSYFSSTETELVKKYAELDAEGNPVFEGPGRVRFRTGDDLVAFTRERNELDDVELGEEIARATIFPPAQISPEQLEALFPYVDIKEVAT